MTTPYFSETHLYAILHLFAFSFWYGTLLWVSFVAGLIMIKNMQRFEFGSIQAKLFPAYFKLGNVCGLVLIATYFKMFGFTENVGEILEVFCLLLMLFLNFIEWVWIGPWVTSVMMKRYQAEKNKEDAKVKALSKEFGVSHGISSLINLMIILSATTYTSTSDFTLANSKDIWYVYPGCYDFECNECIKTMCELSFIYCQLPYANPMYE